MVEFLVGEQSPPLVQILDVVLLAPKDIPIVALCLLISALLHGVEDRVGEVGPELGVVAAYYRVYIAAEWCSFFKYFLKCSIILTFY